MCALLPLSSGRSMLESGIKMRPLSSTTGPGWTATLPNVLLSDCAGTLKLVGIATVNATAQAAYFKLLMLIFH